MKKMRFRFTILILTLVFLGALVGIQISWILKGASMQEAQFNHSVSMAMNRIIDNLSREQSICREVSNCLREGTEGSCYIVMKSREEWANIGTMIRNDLGYYGINLNFEFDIAEINPDEVTLPAKNVYVSEDLEQLLKQSGYGLRIRFPGKKEFIKAQIGSIFIFSIALIALVSFSFIMVFGFYKKEKRLSENIADFINNITHEFKTPLTNISLANSMISKSSVVEIDQKLSFYSDVIKTEHEKLKLRVEQLLKSSLTDMGDPSYSECIDVSSVLENLTETYSVQINERGGSISFRKEGNCFNILGNLDLFHIAMGNVIDNAIIYCDSIPDIRIFIKSGKDKLSINISDNGIGINKTDIGNIFEKYYRIPTGNLHKNDGFGLGLFHVKNIVSRMSGKIKVSSIPEKGSTFSIEFPVAGS